MSLQNFRAADPPVGVRRSHPGRFLAAAGLAAIAAMVLPAPLAHADTVDVKCSVPDLVAAVNRANSSPGPDTLRLARKCTYRLVTPDPANSSSGLPAITSDITIEGKGATITRARSAPEFRILFVDDAGTLKLNKTTISGGAAPDCPNFPGGGAYGGGISSLGTLTVRHSRVVNNTAESSVFAEGGGIESGNAEGVGAATLEDTEISKNTAVYNGDVQSSAAGGGVLNNGPLTVERTRFTNNAVRVTENTDSLALGAAAAFFAQTTIRDSLISGNSSTAPGGTARGALNNSATVTVTDTVIRDNTASAPGGTANGGAAGNGGTLSLTRTRVIGNHATAPAGGTVTGGAISLGPEGALALNSSTVRGNTASAPGGTARGGGISNDLGGTVTTERSQISNNTANAPDGGTARGGGIFNAVGSTTLNRSAVTENRAGDGGGIFEESGTVTLNDTEVKRNRPNNCAPPNSVPGCVG
ncbi:hypothetical protein [Streptomyces sp. V1I6]|uniref:hypothetical protein n=1 Tax=Streptomyces sp. V1I6 TaxID=3042273 RepID=UPI002783A254|nr:hypothetical protein [Streptomyces sp. V1I6]MDQ0847365.1 hypothetical protein [Streptomyces sp. V1I6]